MRILGPMLTAGAVASGAVILSLFIDPRGREAGPDAGGEPRSDRDPGSADEIAHLQPVHLQPVHLQPMHRQPGYPILTDSGVDGSDAAPETPGDGAIVDPRGAALPLSLPLIELVPARPIVQRARTVAINVPGAFQSRLAIALPDWLESRRTSSFVPSIEAAALRPARHVAGDEPAVDRRFDSSDH